MNSIKIYYIQEVNFFLLEKIYSTAFPVSVDHCLESADVNCPHNHNGN